jgi:hypothetical protein
VPAVPGTSKRDDGLGERGGVAQGRAEDDAVVVRAAVSGVGEVSAVLQVRDDLLDRALGEQAAGGDVADPGAGIAGDVGQYPGVVRQERPRALVLQWHFVM